MRLWESMMSEVCNLAFLLIISASSHKDLVIITAITDNSSPESSPVWLDTFTSGIHIYFEILCAIDQNKYCLSKIFVFICSMVSN